MKFEDSVSLAVALGFHAAVLLLVPGRHLGIPSITITEVPTYIEVTLSAPAPKAEVPVPTVAPPAPAPLPPPITKPPESVPAPPPVVKAPEPVVIPLKPEMIKPIEPAAIQTAAALSVPPETVAPPAPMVSSKPAVTAAVPGKSLNSTNAGPKIQSGTEVSRGLPSLGLDYTKVDSPSYLEQGKVEYPSRARRLKQQGLVVVTLYINQFGTLDKVELKESSGFVLLDEAALTGARKSKFKPAYMGNRPVPSKAEVPYRFQLK